VNTEAPAGRTSSRTKTKLSIDRFQGCLRDPSSQGASILRPVHWGAILVHGLWEIQSWRWVRRLLEDADVQDPELAVGRSGNRVILWVSARSSTCRLGGQRTAGPAGHICKTAPSALDRGRPRLKSRPAVLES
jgi:hypothetical protein